MGSTTKMLAKIERRLDELTEIKAVWQKHDMPLRNGSLAMSLNEVLLHYKGYLTAEKQDKTAPQSLLRNEVTRLGLLLKWSKEGLLCNGCNQHKDACHCGEDRKELDDLDDTDDYISSCWRRTATEQAALDAQAKTAVKRHIASTQALFDECAKEAKQEQQRAAFRADPAHCRHYNVAQLGRGYTRCADCGRYQP